MSNIIKPDVANPRSIVNDPGKIIPAELDQAIDSANQTISLSEVAITRFLNKPAQVLSAITDFQSGLAKLQDFRKTLSVPTK